MNLALYNQIAMKRESKKKPGGVRGGQREGAGRPAIGVRKVQLTLNDVAISKGTEIGEGNLSQGVRIAVKEYKKPAKRKRRL